MSAPSGMSFCRRPCMLHLRYVKIKKDGVLFGIFSILATVGFLTRTYYLKRYGQRHNFGRTESIYWPTQIAMTLAALVAWILALQHYNSKNRSDIFVWGSISMGASWIFATVLNRYEHDYEIRSSSIIYAYYVATFSFSVIILQTGMDLPETLPRILGVPTIVVFVTILGIGFIFEAWPRGSTRVQQISGASRYGKANLLSRLTFFFLQPIINISLHRTLTMQDIAGQLQEDMTSKAANKKLSTRWNERLKRQKRDPTANPPSLFWTIMLTDWLSLIPVLLSRIAIVLLSYLLPVFLKLMLSYLDSYETKPLSYGIKLACGMFLASLGVSLLNTYNRFQMLLMGVSTRSALISMIYRKSLRLSAGSRNESSFGEIQNHMSVDADNWWDAVVSLSMWISIPLELAISMTMLYSLLGWTMLAGVLAMLALLPLQGWQAQIFESMQDEKLTAMDQRVRITTEVLSSMKIVKLYGWSKAFLDRITLIRKKELEALRRIGLVQSFMSIAFISSSLIISLITFGVYAVWGGPNLTPGTLTPEIVFVSMSLFAMLKGPIASLSDATTTTISVLVGTKRIQEFLLKEEVNELDIVRFHNLPRNPEDSVISIKEASYSWSSPLTQGSKSTVVMDERTALLLDTESEYHTTQYAGFGLQKINLEVKRQQLTAIVGRVGMGKSSLLSALIGDMYKLKGQVQISGSIAYVPQQAWIVNATLKDNILFGADYDEDRYKKVVYASGLEPDIAMLPGGDMTEIGERGINLSGGQKQRVSLARAAYQDADIYLLDDPLSAVDAHVDRHLWDHLIGPAGLLGNKARVLVTHGIHHLREVDLIVVLKDGEVAEKGHYSDLMGARNAFYRLIKDYSKMERRRSQSTLKLQRRRSSVANIVAAASEDVNSAEQLEVVSTDVSQVPSEEEDDDEDGTTDLDTSEGEADHVVAVVEETKDVKKDTKAELIAAERMKEGGVGFGVLLVYAKAASYGNVIMIFLLFVLAQSCLVSTSLWLKYWIKWTKESEGDEPPPLRLFLGVYAALTLAYVLTYVVVMWLGLVVARIQASERIHLQLLEKVLRLPMAFFDTTPLGRIINRFSSDIFAVDIRIPNKCMDIFLFGISVTSTLLVIVFTTPSFVVVVPFLLLGYYAAQACFLSASRTLARIYSVSKSPVYQHFNESLAGVSTIRAMQVHERFISMSDAKTDVMTNNFLSNMSSRRWLDVQLRLLSSSVLFSAALLAVLGRRNLDPSLVGLTLSFAMSITEEVATLVRNFCDLQNQLVNMERVLEYTDLKTEAPEITPIRLPPNWPSEGRISFRNYSTRYREGLDLVIKNVSMEIKPSEKVGIVGRTGAGKSSLTLALFRIVEAANSTLAKDSDNSQVNLAYVDPKTGQRMTMAAGGSSRDLSLNEEEEDGGSIEIDGVDISTVGLQTLRQHLAIIPQDPTLFAGTLRENLDPFNELEDFALWEALDRSHLKSFISTLPGGLNFEVTANGDNFSVGQRSLICLARALLRKSKILILDEATAAVDVETDELIQRTIRKEFSDRTILTIAHRIKTVMDNDRILVLDKGRVQEFESPATLLKNEDSLFYKLAEQAGEV
ncbi:Multidrug resistance-associated protein 1 [Gryganskiella cystojenkinii]|nr:Multidrug resistance-associated protein 1 [Gryganskiella cystojenkinii]